MPATNKEMFRRLMAIDEMLSNGLYSTEEIRIRLKEKGMSVTARTVQNDLKVIEEDFGIPLNKSRNKYEYKDPQKRIFQKELSEVERNVLSSVLQTLGQFKGIKQFEWLDKLESSLEVKSDERTIIEFSHMFDFGENSEQTERLLPRLFPAIHDKRTIRLTYQAYTDKKPKKIDVYPYLLKEYNDRWYLICAEVGTEPLRYVAKGVDRIMNFDYLEEPYKDPDIDFEDYFDNFIGVTDFNNDAEDVLLCVNPEHQIDRYLRSKPLHSSQAEVKGEELEVLKKDYELFKDWTFFKLKGIKPNNELYQTLVLYLGDLVVLKPDSVRNKLVKRLRNLLSLYDQIKE